MAVKAFTVEIGARRLERLRSSRCSSENGSFGMQSADDVHFGRALVVGLLRLARHLVDVVGELALLLVRAARKGAELAAQDADVGVVEIEIEDVGRDVAVLALAHVIGEIAERVEVLDRVEAQAFLVGQALRGEDFLRDVGQARRAR